MKKERKGTAKKKKPTFKVTKRQCYFFFDISEVFEYSEMFSFLNKITK